MIFLNLLKAICGNDTIDYTDKTVLILGGGDGGILNYLRKNHKPKVRMSESAFKCPIKVKKEILVPT